jgi:hypothetical protein
LELYGFHEKTEAHRGKSNRNPGWREDD